MDCTINVYRNGQLKKTLTAPQLVKLHSLLQGAGFNIGAMCGGMGVCWKCLVRLSPDGEPIRACQSYVSGDMDVYLPPEEKLEVEGAEKDSKRAEDYKGPFGIAADIGTTSVVVQLVDMATGTVLGAKGEANEQRTCGADVVRRISHASVFGCGHMTKLIRKQIYRLAESLCQETGADMAEIKDISIAGNTVMEYLFCGIDPTPLGTAPFTMEEAFGKYCSVPDTGFSPDARIYIAPCVAAYFGGDITAGMAACELDDKRGTVVYLDVGTNGEAALLHDGVFYCCSAAAGPAFEGAEITKGSAAVPGAVCRVYTENGKLCCETVGNAKPVSICGSGLVDALAEMLRLGAVDETGRLLSKEEAPESIREYYGQHGTNEAFFVDAQHCVPITAGDIRKLQLAKAAMCAGLETLMAKAGVHSADEFVLAGGFGSRLNAENAAYIGLFPKSLLPCAVSAGNAAAKGAVLTLCVGEAREKAAETAAKCKYIELSGDPFFSEAFVECISFGEQ